MMNFGNGGFKGEGYSVHTMDPVPGVHVPFDNQLKEMVAVVKSDVYIQIDNNIDLTRQISANINKLNGMLSIILTGNNVLDNPQTRVEKSIADGKTPLESKLINCNMQLHDALLQLERLIERVSL